MPVVKMFVSYSHRDSDRVARLKSHCAPLIKQGLVHWWYDRAIPAGGRLDDEIGDKLEGAHLFLAMVSPDFLESHYCYERELARALERHQAGELIIVPVILEPCDWQHSPLQKLKAAPEDGRPVSMWANDNEAYLDIITSLRGHLEEPRAAASVAMDAGLAAPSRPMPHGRYRARKDFDAVEREDFIHDGFLEIRDYFRRECESIGQENDLSGRCRDLAPNGFSCTIVNRRLSRGTAHITIYAGRGYTSLGDIHYSFDANAPENTANGWLTVASDDYDLFLKYTEFAAAGSERRVTPTEAAELLWIGTLNRAGITHD